MDDYPRQNARTRRFTCGVARTFAVADDGSRVVFLRSTAGDDPVNALWSLDPVSGEERLVADPETDLQAKLPHGTGQTVLREALVVADHNAYHLGQLVLLRGLLTSTH